MEQARNGNTRQRTTKPGWAILRPEGTVAYIGGSDSLPAPLTRDEENALFARLPEEPDSVHKALIEHNLRLVVYIARKFENTGVGLEDLISIGTIGLIKAVNTFDPAKKIKLATYASRCIENEILMHLRANRKLRNTLSMSDSVTFDKEGNEVQLTELMGTERDIVPDEVEKRISSGIALQLIDQVLDPRQARVIRLRYGLEDGVFHPQHEVAKQLGISRSYVSRIEKRALEILKNHME